MMGWKVGKGETGESSKSEWKDNVTFSKGRLALTTKMECISGRIILTICCDFGK